MEKIRKPACSPQLCHQGFLYDTSCSYIRRLEDVLQKQTVDELSALSLRAGIVALSDIKESIAFSCSKDNDDDNVCQTEMPSIGDDERLVAKLYVAAVVNQPVSYFFRSK